MTRSHKNLRYISTCMVKPASKQANEDTPQTIDLTPWDLNFLACQYMQRGLLYKTPKTTQNQHSNQGDGSMNTIINHLRNSLEKTLDHFSPLAGRLATEKQAVDDEEDEPKYSVYINCGSSGAEFIHAAMDVTIADILNPVYVPLDVVRSLFTLEGALNYDGQSRPLLSIQVTELIDGIFVGCSINHSVCDGSSFWHFFTSWSEICKGGGHGSNHHNRISLLPVFKRWFPENLDCPPIRLPFSIGDKDFTERNRYIPSPSFALRIFHFTRENIAKLKAKVNLEQTESKDDENNISSFQALLSHIWLAVTRARCLDSEDEETSYQLVVGNRSRLNPALPDGYVGNSVLIKTTTVKATDDDAAIRSHYEMWVKKPLLMTRDGVVSQTATVMTGGSPRSNMHHVDFGWGKPIAGRAGIANMRQGKVIATAGPVEGSVNLEVYFSLDILKAMADDPEFMEVVTILPPYKSAEDASFMAKL
ncbi:hypothetical protein MKX03_019793 [Papaver bracteatum]|nr:hypothetical protein MKX03_019793 [Papaver bracteatum]